MIIYISGPMTGLPEDNKPAFNAAAQILREQGHTVICPAEIEVQEPSWENYLREDIRQMMSADTLVQLPGWSHSRGANLEYEIAAQLGMAIKRIDHFKI